MKSSVDTYALLDNGSEVTLLDAQLAEQLGTKCIKEPLVMNTFNASGRLISGRVSFWLDFLVTEEFNKVATAYITHSLKLVEPKMANREVGISKRHLFDKVFPVLQDNKVKLLVGCNVPSAHKVLEERYGDKDYLYATKTPLRWTIRGPMLNSRVSSLVTDNCVSIERMVRDLNAEEFHSESYAERGRPSKIRRRTVKQ
ncbi:unnamed protein product [Trichobilharzia regenti]|nr:unnamed protein product [Trichobilharzia regenti]